MRYNDAIVEERWGQDVEIKSCIGRCGIVEVEDCVISRLKRYLSIMTWSNADPLIVLETKINQMRGTKSVSGIDLPRFKSINITIVLPFSGNANIVHISIYYFTS